MLLFHIYLMYAYWRLSIYDYVFINYWSMYMCSSMYVFYVIYVLLMDDAWKKENNSHVVPSLIFKLQCTTWGGVIHFDRLSIFISKMKSYLCCHQSPKRGRLKVHLGPYLISVIENNPNKNLIVSMSIKQELRQQKEEKEKETPPNSCQSKWRVFKGVQGYFNEVFFYISWV
jgi:hypothetical protein